VLSTVKVQNSEASVLFAQRANVERYPPVLHQLRVLSEFSACTVLDELRVDEEESQHSSDHVRRKRVRSSKLAEVLGPAGKLQNALAFASTFSRLLRQKPKVAIAYDPFAAAQLLRRRSSAPKRIVHLHELLNVNAGGRADRLSVKYLRQNLRNADLVVVPDPFRARLTQDFAKLNAEPAVVMNCPALLPRVPSSKLLPALRERGVETSKIVHYQGSVGAEHGLELIIDSMQYWPQEAVFVIVGGGKKEYLTSLRERAAALGMSHRLVLLGLVPYREVFAYAVGASVGLTLLDCSIENWLYSAGASNKRFEYAALGTAQITNAGPGMTEVFGKGGLAMLLDDVAPRALGRAIASVLDNPEIAGAMGQRARAAHLSSYNYESQFAPVAERIHSWMFQSEQAVSSILASADA
jgi:glycosyltransferase involved in cell wall biosynthesis